MAHVILNEDLWGYEVVRGNNMNDGLWDNRLWKCLWGISMNESLWSISLFEVVLGIGQTVSALSQF